MTEKITNAPVLIYTAMQIKINWPPLSQSYWSNKLSQSISQICYALTPTNHW